MKETTGQSSHITDQIIPIIEGIFQITEQGLAYCYCCKEFINLQDSVEDQFMKHFNTDTPQRHSQFILLHFQNHKSENTKNLLINNKTLCMRDVTEEVKQNMFLQIKDRQAFCKWCNKTINVPGSIGEEFMLHYNNKFHEQFFTSLMKVEKNQNRKVLYKHLKKNNLAKKYIVLRCTKLNGQITKAQICLVDAEETDEFKQKKVKMEEIKLNQLLELIKKYFEPFISELIKVEYHLEALCFILAIIGKEESQICELLFESLAEEIKNLLPNQVLSQQLLKMLQNTFVILWEQIGFTNEGYLLKQPFQVQQLRQLLENAKGSFIIKTEDENYKKFLMKVQIEELNNFENNLQQRYLFSNQNKQKKTEKKLIEVETKKDNN